jgi:hypothetical protein
MIGIFFIGHTSKKLFYSLYKTANTDCVNLVDVMDLSLPETTATC